MCVFQPQSKCKRWCVPLISWACSSCYLTILVPSYCLLMIIQMHPNAYLGDVPGVVRNVLFAGHNFIDRASLFGHFMNPYDAFASFKLAPARHFSYEKKRKRTAWFDVSHPLVTWYPGVFFSRRSMRNVIWPLLLAMQVFEIIWDDTTMKLRTRSVLFKASSVSKCPIRTWWCERRCLQARNLLIDKSLSSNINVKIDGCLIAQLVSSRLVHFWVCSSCVVMTSLECAQRWQSFFTQRILSSSPLR